MSIRPAWQESADVVAIGTGVGGLAAALAAHRAGRRVVVLSKAGRKPGGTATHYAQGGIAVVLPDTDDSVDAHVADTLAAGAGLCDPDAVTSIVADGYRAMTELVSDGARFDETAAGGWALGREGGHSRRRIVHANGDATGAEVQRALDHAAAALGIRTNHTALGVLHDASSGIDSVTGVLVANPDGIGIVHAASVILATGGLGHLYGATTNPDGSTGDGIALALWAGVAVSDIEFIQFHPTMLFDHHSGGRRPLVTEAIRGEGAVLVDRQGNSVTAGVHPMGDLAPRDVVAAAIDARLRATGDPCVYLDARSITAFADRFPTVTAACRAAGIDPVHRPIPVIPGAHYSCGGVVTDVHGQTGLPGLFAAGEVARTGMHGANRLASNSLLEGLVVGGRAGRAAAAHAELVGRTRAMVPEPVRRPALARGDLQRAMSRDASVVRDADGLRRLTGVLSTAAMRTMLARADLEDAALTVTARAVATAASARNESRGCHHRAEYPGATPAQACNVVVRLGDDDSAQIDALAAVC
ncbi:L-aspartate oxidase [Candidatus Mycobacterium methanotrophicum]|uniref:L-aspartate oxidase n=1 Tax=Candidatus Mycobacterium methanotrophicum TaxID=2943498 RepID=A0ABY4QJB5_9MYCO|nr:L-aspartate oxidase [Candidatus Mycobacterium methanotrophicum]UQX09775.1 L-aspartate oxidase [Candidatus Mycobacterium methanotrophicum]